MDTGMGELEYMWLYVRVEGCAVVGTETALVSCRKCSKKWKQKGNTKPRGKGNQRIGHENDRNMHAKVTVLYGCM